MKPNKAKVRVHSSDSLPEIMTLDINKLGRPYHKIPKIVGDYFAVIESQISLYFLKKYRVNITLKDIKFKTDCLYRNVQTLSSQIGHVAFDIDRTLLLNILNDYYGLTKEKNMTSVVDNIPKTQTEERLKSKLSIEIADLILNQPVFGEPLVIKNNNSTPIVNWSYRMDFLLKDYENGGFTLLIDTPHVDRLLKTLNTEHKEEKKNKTLSMAQFDRLVSQLPIRLTSQLSCSDLTFFDLMEIKEGDIIPASLPERFPVFIGKQPLFSAVVTESRGKLFLSEFNDKTNEMPHD
ncbi:FliM/FliN family flagellar motor switch protein [Yersinia intermedia]|jgi:flagellar motor switch protein FliM|uniref:FliM/FliN family flagellar motor switch protein n=1 Tax=Yersinia intermedia TaxID=631 RepID=UPI0005E6A0D1|nr:FliM/FliN family flagellar motor switch protein [Yersinia intermedia]CNC13725.1 flagellar motor switch protein [Yersinia intermedia]CRE92606.1 flagellar motor switch protein [Yersinia intermedia]